MECVNECINKASFNRSNNLGYYVLITYPSMPYKATTQYVHISTVIDTSIKHPISDQSTSVVKRLYGHMFNMEDTAFSY